MCGTKPAAISFSLTPPDQYVYVALLSRIVHAGQGRQHAQIAVELYRTLYSDKQPTEQQQQSKDRLVKYAEAVLAGAVDDAEQFPHLYTDEDIQWDIEALAEAEEAEEAKLDEAEQQGDNDVDVREELPLPPSEALPLPTSEQSHPEAWGNVLSEGVVGGEQGVIGEDEGGLPLLHHHVATWLDFGE